MSDVQLIKIAKHILLGPDKKNLHLNKHDFNIKAASVVVRPDGKTDYIAGQISHRLAMRPDDQIYYKIKFVDGMALDPILEVDRGGVASVLRTILSALTFDIGLKFGDIEIRPDKIADVATEVSKMVEGRGWEAQVAAMLAQVSMIASNPPIASYFDEQTKSSRRGNSATDRGNGTRKKVRSASGVSTGHKVQSHAHR